MTTSPRVAITRALPGETALPGAVVDVAREHPRMSRDELLAFVKGASVVVSMFHDRVDDAFLGAAGPGLKGVCTYAVGFNNIDLDACRRRSVIVTNTPDAVTEGTANIAFALLLAAARRLVPADRFCRDNRFVAHGPPSALDWCGVHLSGRTMLIVGAGRIGRAVALRAHAFGMRIEYTARSRHLDFEQAPLAARHVDLDDALPRADVVSIHTPLTPETHHLLSARRIALLKPDAIVINTSRGPTIDEAALADALARKAIFAAGLDVFEHEPEIHPTLRTLDNVVMTPHIGSAETYWREQMTRIVLDNAAAILAGRQPPNRIA